MRYIIPLFDCCLSYENALSLYKNVKYKCENVDNKNFVVYGKNNEIPFCFNIVDKHSFNVEKVKFKTDEYYFLFSKHQ